MRRRNTELLGDVILQFLKQRKLDKPLYEKRLIDSWPEVLGKHIMTYTTEIYIKKRVLYVKLNSSVLRNDLFMSKDNILESLNKHAGNNVIDDIKFS